MVKHLVIVESPAKAKTINKFLGRDYIVKASMGHVRDLPTSKLGVDVEKDFAPQYVNSKDKAKVIKELREAARKADRVILAPDPDREGEAIAWHLREILRKDLPDESAFSRVTYNQITKSAILKAFSEPGELNMRKVDAQQARRVIDRLVGYQVSPLLWRRIRGGSSAGRVQTVALRLVCEREKEILAFVPETYWVFGAKVRKQSPPVDPFEIRLVKVDGQKGEIRDTQHAEEIRKDLQGRSVRVSAIQNKEVQRRPQPPFITSTLQQAASSAYGFQPNRTMSLAQDLYEGVDLGTGEGPTGLITYMRTDSFHLAPEAIAEIRACVAETFGADHLPEKPNYYRSRGSAQEAHESIRPTDMRRTPESLKGVLEESAWKLYSLIWKRTMASQMAPARINQLTVDLIPEGASHDYLFRATASQVVFPGYMAAWGRGLSEEDEEGDSYLPPLAVGEVLDVLEWLNEQKQTQPPKRYSEAALIKALEENGVGRPSTYASIVSTLYQREYVEREARSLRPTKAGMEVNDFLVRRFPQLFEVDFTARMEERLDEIEEGTLEWTALMREFYARLEGWLQEARMGNVDQAQLRQLLDLAGEIRTWNPPTQRGKKTYDDATFVREIREALETGKVVTDRQVDNLRKIVARYRDQILSLTEERIAALGLGDLIAKEAEASAPPTPETLKKFELLEKVTFEPRRKVGKKVYDDRAFFESLREQVASGKRLSDNQVFYLNKLVNKYAAQIPDFERLAPELGMDAAPEQDTESGPLLELLAQVKTFAEPTVRGEKTWDDAEFAASLQKQYASRKSLSPRQRGALKSLVARYHDQIPDYMARREQLGLRDPNAPQRASKRGGGKRKKK